MREKPTENFKCTFNTKVLILREKFCPQWKLAIIYGITHRIIDQGGQVLLCSRPLFHQRCGKVNAFRCAFCNPWPRSSNSATFVHFNSILGFLEESSYQCLAWATQCDVCTKRWHRSTFCHCLCCILWKSAVCHNATRGEQTTICISVLTTPDNTELPVGVVPVMTDHRPCETLRNQTRNLLASRCQVPTSSWPHTRDARQSCSSNRIISKGRNNGPSTNQAAHCGRTLRQLHSLTRVQTICYPSVDSRMTAAFSHFYQRDLVRCPPEKEKKKHNIWGKKNQKPSARIKI